MRARIKVPKMAQNIFNNQQQLEAAMEGSRGWRRWGVMTTDDDGRRRRPLMTTMMELRKDEAAVNMDGNGIVVNLLWQRRHDDGCSATTTCALSSSLPGIATTADRGWQWTVQWLLNGDGLEGNGQ